MHISLHIPTGLSTFTIRPLYPFTKLFFYTALYLCRTFVYYRFNVILSIPIVLLLLVLMFYYLDNTCRKPFVKRFWESTISYVKEGNCDIIELFLSYHVKMFFLLSTCYWHYRLTLVASVCKLNASLPRVACMGAVIGVLLRNSMLILSGVS